MERETVVVPEKKKKIENIKKKYNNMSMTDETATKIRRLEITNNILKAATIAAGIVTVVDLFIPDPLLGLDEVALTAITGLCGGASSLVENKIEKLANDQDANLKMDEISKLSNQMVNVANAINKKHAL